MWKEKICCKGCKVTMLTLPIKKKYFDMIISGEKTTEYRKLNKYYLARLFRYLRSKDLITLRLRNGYGKKSPTIQVSGYVELGKGSEQPEYLDYETWYYAIRIKEVIHVN